MKNWLERGGWIIVFALFLFLSFCVFARVHLGANYEIQVPIIDSIDLFAYTAYASTEAPEPEFLGEDETEQEETLEVPQEETGDNTEEQPLEEPPQEEPPQEEPPPEEPQPEELPQEEPLDELQPEAPEQPETAAEDEPEEFDDETDDENDEESEEYPDSEFFLGGDTPPEITEIRDILQVLLLIVLLCIGGFCVYIILKPLWWFLFY